MLSPRRITGIVLIALGAGLLFLSNSIAEQVSEGRQKISRGQSQVNTIDNLFSTTPYTKDVGKAITKPAQKKINEGIMEADYYEQVSSWCKMGGIGLIIVGAGLIVLPQRRRHG